MRPRAASLVVLLAFAGMAGTRDAEAQSPPAAAPSGPLPGDATLSPRVDLGWLHSFTTVRPGETMAFSASGQAFNVLGVPLGEHGDGSPALSVELFSP